LNMAIVTCWLAEIRCSVRGVNQSIQGLSMEVGVSGLLGLDLCDQVLRSPMGDLEPSWQIQIRREVP
jgi:hypothetical protein